MLTTRFKGRRFTARCASELVRAIKAAGFVGFISAALAVVDVIERM